MPLSKQAPYTLPCLLADESFSELVLVYRSAPLSYVCELAPPTKRRDLTTMSQLFSATGIMTRYFVCDGTIRIDSSLSWRLPLALLSFLAFLFAAVCAPLPQSPRWPTLCGRHEESQLLWVRLGFRPAVEGVESSD